MSELAFKRGTTFRKRVAYIPGDNEPATLVDTAISSEIRTAVGGTLIATLVVEKNADNLGFTVKAPGGTATWPLGVAHWDIKFVFPGDDIQFTKTESIEVLREVTQCQP
jgi:hypothetical protein